MLFSGCLALLWAGATLMTRHTVSIAGSSSSSVASLMFQRTPMSTGVSGGVAAAIGRKAISTAVLHERLAADFEAFADEAMLQVQVIQQLRTRLKRLARAVEQVLTLFRLQVVACGVDNAVWTELGDWIEAYEESLGRLMKGSVGLASGVSEVRQV